MNQNGEYILVAITVLLIAAGGIVFFDSSLNLRLEQPNVPAPITTTEESQNDVATSTPAPGVVKVTIDFGDGTIIENSRDTSRPLDARDVVYLAAVSNKFSVRAGERFLPTAIGGIANEEEGKQWTLYINGKSTDSLERVTVSPGDILMLKYE